MKKKFILIIVSLLFVAGCTRSVPFEGEYDFLLSKSKKGSSRGTIVLIHGQAPANIDGRIPVVSDSMYTKVRMFRDLAEKLNEKGWDVVRYGKYGVYEDHVDYDKYKKTDLEFTVSQIKDVWHRTPKDKPIVVFAVSEGTLHAHFLPLDEADAVILLGAVSGNLRDVLLDQADTPEKKEQAKAKIDEAYKMKRDEMHGRSAPAGRFVDEFGMRDNWTYYAPYKAVPFLVLHGEADREVKLYNSEIWKKKLPHHDITVVTKPNGNHVYGIGDSFDAEDLATTVDGWLNEKLSNRLSSWSKRHGLLHRYL